MSQKSGPVLAGNPTWDGVKEKEKHDFGIRSLRLVRKGPELTFGSTFYLVWLEKAMSKAGCLARLCVGPSSDSSDF